MIAEGPLKVMSTKCGVRDPEIQVLMFDIEALICNLLTEENPLLAGNYRVWFLVHSVVLMLLLLSLLLLLLLLWFFFQSVGMKAWWLSARTEGRWLDLDLVRVGISAIELNP